MIKREITVNIPLGEVLKLAHAWLLSNSFKIEKEVVKGSRAVIATKGPAHGSINIYVSSNPHKSNILLRGKNEVLSLITYLESGGMPLQPQLQQQQQQQQQQQIVVNITPPSPPNPIMQPSYAIIECPFCHTPGLNPSAIFCKRCGQRLMPVQPASPPLRGDSSIFCNACGARLTPDAAFCKQCGVAIVHPAPNESTREAKPPIMPELIFCSYCGAENDGTAEVCSSCGATLIL